MASRRSRQRPHQEALRPSGRRSRRRARPPQIKSVVSADELPRRPELVVRTGVQERLVRHARLPGVRIERGVVHPAAGRSSAIRRTASVCHCRMREPESDQLLRPMSPGSTRYSRAGPVVRRPDAAAAERGPKSIRLWRTNERPFSVTSVSSELIALASTWFSQAANTP